MLLCELTSGYINSKKSVFVMIVRTHKPKTFKDMVKNRKELLGL